MQETEYEPTTSETSKYNDAINSVIRLHQHWLACEIYANAGNLIKWKYRLDSVWRELYPDIKRKPEAKKFITRNKELMEKVAQSKTKIELYFNLCVRHEWLREIQDFAGKANVYMDENADAFE